MDPVLERLEQAGNDVDGALRRFMGNEPMYLGFLLTLGEDDTYSNLMTALDNNDVDAGFRASHSLKGLYGNLGLTKLFELTIPLVESLRVGTPVAPEDPHVAALRAEHEATLELLG